MHSLFTPVDTLETFDPSPINPMNSKPLPQSDWTSVDWVNGGAATMAFLQPDGSPATAGQHPPDRHVWHACRPTGPRPAARSGRIRRPRRACQGRSTIKTIR